MEKYRLLRLSARKDRGKTSGKTQNFLSNPEKMRLTLFEVDFSAAQKVQMEVKDHLSARASDIEE